MAIPSSRGSVTTTVTIDEDACNGCGFCVTACPEKNIIIKGKKATQVSSRY